MIASDDILIAALAELDDNTFAHCRRVQALAVALGKKMGLSFRELSQLGLGALLHDLGKKDIASHIFRKKTALTPEEKELLELHPVLGWNIVSSLEIDVAVKYIILGHHWWYNGEGGYPNSFKNFKPSFLTQVTSVANAVDVLINSPKPRADIDLCRCLEYLEQNTGTEFNGEIVQAFKTMVTEKDIGFDLHNEWKIRAEPL